MATTSTSTSRQIGSDIKFIGGNSIHKQYSPIVLFVLYPVIRDWWVIIIFGMDYEYGNDGSSDYGS